MAEISYKQEVSQRLWTAHRRAAEVFDRALIGRDYHHGTEIANEWMYIAAAYSGIEQVYKFLIADDHEMSVTEFRKDGKHDHHDIHALFCELKESGRALLSEHYACFQSLHNYIEPRSVEEFLREISEGKRNSGSVRWRYALVEPEGLPRNSPDAMMAIWEAGTQLVDLRRSPHRPFLMPPVALCRRLEELGRQAVCNGNDLTSSDGWKKRTSGNIDEWALLLWKAARGLPSTDDDETGSKWHERLLEAARGRRNLSQFAVRAIGGTSGGRGIRWNSGSRRFEDLPWETDIVTQAQKPGNGQHIGAHDMLAAWRYILGIAHRGGFTTKERCFEPTNDQVWQQTLYATKGEADSNLTMEIWVRLYEPDMYVVVHGEDCQAVAKLRGLVGHWQGGWSGGADDS